MISEIENLKQEYLSWLSKKIQFKAIDEWVEMTTPYLDRHNDYIQIYIKKRDGGYLLTDDSYTLSDLEHSGCSLSSKKRQEILRMTLNGFGVRLDEKALSVDSTRMNFALKKHNLIQAILAVNDLFYLANPLTTSLFLEDVTYWLETNNIRNVSNVKFTGSSGFDHQFDFIIPKSLKEPDRYIRAINNPDRTTAESYAWAWFDTREARQSGKAIALLNDIDRPVPQNVLTALLNYEITPIKWSEKEYHLLSLAA